MKKIKKKLQCAACGKPVKAYNSWPVAGIKIRKNRPRVCQACVDFSVKTQQAEKDLAVIRESMTTGPIKDDNAET